MSVFDKLIRKTRSQPPATSSAENQKKAENENIAMMSVDAEGKTSWVNIDELTIQHSGVQVGRLLVPFESIVEIKTPKFIIGVGPKSKSETNTVELREGEGVLAIRWKRSENSKPESIVLRLPGADGVSNDILIAIKTIENKMLNNLSARITNQSSGRLRAAAADFGVIR